MNKELNGFNLGHGQRRRGIGERVGKANITTKSSVAKSSNVYRTARNVFIMGYVTFSLGCYMVCCSAASLAVGYIYLSCSHLYSFASYDRPYALTI